jgi:hypothetical protein
MATFKIEVDVDWVGEDQSVDQIIKDEIAATIIKTVSEKAIRDIEEKVNNTVNATVLEKINAKMNELLQDFMNQKRTITDKYGDVKRRDVSVIDLLKEQCDAYFDGKVDRNGRPFTGSYGEKPMSRIDYLVQENITDQMERSIKDAAGKIKTAMQQYIDETLKAQIGENIARAIGLDKITAKI